MTQKILPPIPFPNSAPASATWLEVVGSARPLDPAICTAALRALHGLQHELTLEIRAWSDGIAVGIQVSASSTPLVERALRGATTDWEIAPFRPPPPRARACYAGLISHGRTPAWAALRGLDAAHGSDPLAALLEAVQPLRPDEQMLIRYLVWPADGARVARVWREITSPAPTRGWLGLLELATNTAPRRPRFDAALQRQIERRLSEPLFELIGAVALFGDDRERLTGRAASLTAAYRSQFDGGAGGLTLASWGWQTETRPASATPAPRVTLPTVLVTDGELAGLWHPPSSQVQIPGIVHLRRPASVISPHRLASPGILLGDHHQRGGQIPVQLPAADLRLGHAVLLGRTGTGKSTLKHTILRQLMALPDRPSVVAIDPHGDLSLDLAATIPLHRVRDTVLLELGDAEYPIGLPLLRRPEGVSEEEFIQNTFSLIRLIFRDRWSPTRMEDAVFALVATLAALPDATLLDVPLLFEDEGFRDQVMPFVGDTVVRMFWAEYERLSDSARRELTRPILYRLRAFIRSSAVRNLVARTDGLDLGELVERHAIVLVSLAGSAIQAEADLLGELVLTRLHLSLLARLAHPRQQRQPVYLGIDEAQRLSHATLPTLLGESRKLGLALLLSTQHLAAWGEHLAESVIGNVGTLITFRCGPSDSRRLAHGLRPFTPEQLEDLDRFEAIVKLQIGGQTLPAIDIRTRPIEVPIDLDALAQIRCQTRARYGLPRAEVEARMASRYQRVTVPQITAQPRPRLPTPRQAGPIRHGKINMGDSIASSQIQDQDDLLQPTHKTAAPAQGFDDRTIDDDDDFWQPVGEA